jgi:hypothetical protein
MLSRYNNVLLVVHIAVVVGKVDENLDDVDHKVEYRDRRVAVVAVAEILVVAFVLFVVVVVVVVDNHDHVLGCDDDFLWEDSNVGVGVGVVAYSAVVACNAVVKDDSVGWVDDKDTAIVVPLIVVV